MSINPREVYDATADMEPCEAHRFTAHAMSEDYEVWARAPIRPQPRRPFWPYAVAAIVGAAMAVAIAASLVSAVEAATARQIAEGAVEW